MAELHSIGEELARHSDLEATWRSAIQTAQAAAAAASLAEHDRDQLGTRARRRRAEIDTRITELQKQATQALEAAATAADLAKALTRVPHNQAEHDRLAERIATADTQHNQQHLAAAVARDIESARLVALRASANLDRSAVDHLESEVRRRTELSPHRRLRESIERDAQAEGRVTPDVRIANPEYQVAQVKQMSIDLPSPVAAPPSDQPSL